MDLEDQVVARHGEIRVYGRIEAFEAPAKVRIKCIGHRPTYRSFPRSAVKLLKEVEKVEGSSVQPGNIQEATEGKARSRRPRPR